MATAIHGRDGPQIEVSAKKDTKLFKGKRSQCHTIDKCGDVKGYPDEIQDDPAGRWIGRGLALLLFYLVVFISMFGWAPCRAMCVGKTSEEF